MSDRENGLSFFLYNTRVGRRMPIGKLDPRTLAYFAAMLILIGLAGWLYLYQASEVASYAHEIRKLEQEKERLHRELVALRGRAAMLGSLERALEVGAQNGYSMPDVDDEARILYVEVPAPALTPVRPAPEGKEPARPSTSASDLTWLQQMIREFRHWIDAPPTDTEAR